MQNTVGFEIKDLGLCNNMRLPPLVVISWLKENAWNFVCHVSHTFPYQHSKQAFPNSRIAVLITVANFESYLTI